jgi:CBS domain containing-hemolysin-like protein
MIQLILIACCVVGAAFFEGIETAVLSVNRIKIRHLATRGRRDAIAVERLLAIPAQFLSTMLAGTGVFTVLGSILAATYFTSLFNNRENLGVAVATIVMTPVMLIFAQTLPKVVFYHHATQIALRIIPVLTFFSWLLYPLVQLCSLVTKGVFRVARIQDKMKNPFVTREDLKLLMLGGPSDLKIHEQEMISHLFKFSETEARSIMVPLGRVIAVNIRGTVADAIQRIRETGHSRLPLYKGQMNSIEGYVSVQDILGLDPNLPLGQVKRPVMFLQESKKISEILLQLAETRQHLAMVVNRARKVTGLVTAEDIIEEIVGEIEDEYDAGTRANPGTESGG